MKPFRAEDGLFCDIAMPLPLLLMSMWITLLGMELLVTKTRFLTSVRNSDMIYDLLIQVKTERWLLYRPI